MPLVFRHFRNVALFGFIQLAAWSCVCATECALNASCPVMNNCPSSPECCLFMLEELSIGVEIGNVNIRTDINDILTNNTGEISLNGGGNEVELNETTGTLRIVNRVDREARHMRCLEVAIDLIPDNGLATVRLIGIIVEDINDNSPVFPSSDSPYSVQTKEGTNVSIGIKGVTELSATDPDESYGDVTYSLAGEESDKFEIVMDGDKPCIKNVVELDRDDIPNPSNTPTNLLTLVLVATDNGGEQGNTTFIVNITDVNDNPPVFTEASLETVTIPEDIGDGAIIHDLNATDRDYNNTLTYSLLSNIFHVNGETGEISVLPNENDLSTDGYNLQVAVNDGEHPDVVQTLRVDVQTTSTLKGTAAELPHTAMEPSPTVTTQSDGGSVPLALYISVGTGVSCAILISAIIMLAITLCLCWKRKKNSMNTGDNVAYGVNQNVVDISDNVAYGMNQNVVDISDNVAYVASATSGDKDKVAETYDYVKTTEGNDIITTSQNEAS